MYLFGVLTSLSTHCNRSYHNEQLEGQRKSAHTVGEGSVLQTADQRQATTSFPT